MATRIEKIYRKNSLILLNDTLNAINDYIENNDGITKRECELCKEIIFSIDTFLKNNQVSDTELRGINNAK